MPLPDGPYEVTGRLEIAGQDRERIEPPASTVLPVRLRPLGEQAVLRRLARADRVEGSSVSGAPAQRRLILRMSMSLVGFIARRDGVIDWRRRPRRAARRARRPAPSRLLELLGQPAPWCAAPACATPADRA
jgi:hypothetical protein